MMKEMMMVKKIDTCGRLNCVSIVHLELSLGCEYKQNKRATKAFRYSAAFIVLSKTVHLQGAVLLLANALGIAFLNKKV